MKEENDSFITDSDILNHYLKKTDMPKTVDKDEDDESVFPYIIIIAVGALVYVVTYLLKIELNFWYSTISNIIVLCAIIRLMLTLGVRYNKYIKLKIVLLVLGFISLIYLVNYLNAMHYFRTRIYLAETPITLPQSLYNTDEYTFFSEMKKYEKTTERNFYFDLQWSLRYAKDAKELAKYKHLEQNYMLNKDRASFKLDMLTYNLYEALLNENDRDSIMYYINQIHPGNIYEIANRRFFRISKSRHIIAATPDEEENMAYGNHRKVQTHSRRPRHLLQAIENLKIFTKEEKTKILDKLLKYYVQWAVVNGCPADAVYKFTSRYLTPGSGWYVSIYISEGMGVYEVEENLWKMINVLSASNSNIYMCCDLEDWERFVLSKAR